MNNKYGRIIIGLIIGIVAVLMVWYIIQGWLGESGEVEEVTVIKDDLLTNEVIETVRARNSTIDYPVQVKDGEMGVSNPLAE